MFWAQCKNLYEDNIKTDPKDMNEESEVKATEQGQKSVVVLSRQ